MIYLDNNATTPIAPEVTEEMTRVSEVAFGNPGSRHHAGRTARRILEDSRETIAKILDADPDEVFFTSGGTESSNLAIFGLTAGRTGLVVLPPGEHPATEEPVKRLIQRGYRKKKLELDLHGRIVSDSLEAIDWNEVVLGTALLAHNETGTIQDLSEFTDRCSQNRIPFHMDAVQAVGKIPVSFRSCGATTMSVAAHKFHGPRGVGAILVREGTKLIPQMLGGHQEGGHRAGTEPVVLAAGMGKALQMCHQRLAERAALLSSLRDRLQTGLKAACETTVVNSDEENRLPNTLNISFPGCDADALLVALDLAGVCCSHGSACASGSAEPAPILLGMKCPPKVYQSAIRFSVGVQNSPDEIDAAIEIVSTTVKRLRA